MGDWQSSQLSSCPGRRIHLTIRDFVHRVSSPARLGPDAWRFSPRRRRYWIMKRWLRIGGIAVAVLLLILIALPLLINVNRFRPTVQSEASAALGRQLTVGDLNLSILSGSVGRRYHRHCRRSRIREVAICNGKVAESRR